MKEEIKEFYTKNLKYLQRRLTYSILVCLFMYFTNSDKEIFTTFFYSQLILISIYIFFFKLNEFEKYITRHFTMIMLSWIAIIIYFQTKLWIDNKETLLMIWWIIAFWYWYKKYERDKELEIIEKYTKKYEEIKKELESNINKWDVWKLDFNNLTNLWYEEFFLKSKWYISNELWKEWKYWIKNDITNYLWDIDFQKIEKWISPPIIETFYIYKWENWVSWEFYIFLLWIIKDLKKYFNNLKNNNKSKDKLVTFLINSTSDTYDLIELELENKIPISKEKRDHINRFPKI